MKSPAHAGLFLCARTLRTLNPLASSPQGGRITLSTELDTPHALIRMINAGEGSCASDRARVFNRFERLEAHRGTHGNGLGLSLVRAVVARHHGTVQLGDAHPGLIVEITLPSATAPV
jgi:signal transduction histidine kinase